MSESDPTEPTWPQYSWPPLVLSEKNSEVFVFDRLEDLLRYVEPVDVADNVFDAWDSRGAELVLEPTEPRVSIQEVKQPTSASLLLMRDTIEVFLCRAWNPPKYRR